MIRLYQVASNVTMVELGTIDIYFSYETPVAVRERKGGMFHTSKKYSTTTSRHVNMITDGMNSIEISQEKLEEIISDEFQG